jgi:hypothetical protein
MASIVTFGRDRDVTEVDRAELTLTFQGSREKGLDFIRPLVRVETSPFSSQLHPIN